MKKTIRVVDKFLFLPKRDKNKWYWLKRVSIVEKQVIYEITEWPLIPWGFGGPRTSTEIVWEFLGIVDYSNVIEVFVPDEDSPNPYLETEEQKT